MNNISKKKSRNCKINHKPNETLFFFKGKKPKSNQKEVTTLSILEIMEKTGGELNLFKLQQGGKNDGKVK